FFAVRPSVRMPYSVVAPSSTPPVVSISATGRVRSTSGTPEKNHQLHPESAGSARTAQRDSKGARTASLLLLVLVVLVLGATGGGVVGAARGRAAAALRRAVLRPRVLRGAVASLGVAAGRLLVVRLVEARALEDHPRAGADQPFEPLPAALGAL